MRCVALRLYGIVPLRDRISARLLKFDVIQMAGIEIWFGCQAAVFRLVFVCLRAFEGIPEEQLRRHTSLLDTCSLLETECLALYSQRHGVL